MNTWPRIRRRTFLKGMAAAAGGLVIEYVAAADAPEPLLPPAMKPFAWVKIATDDTVTLTIPEAEMGQGIESTLAMLMADELEVGWNNVKTAWAPLDPLYGDGPRRDMFTGASSSVSTQWKKLRMVGAVTRELLVAAAMKQWGVDRASCSVENGRVTHRGTGRSLGYGALAAGAASVPLPGTVRLKTAGEWKYIGKSVPRLDTRAKVRGDAVFGFDLDLPGMLVAQIEACPFAGGKLLGFKADAALAVPGVRHVLALQKALSPGVAVVADNFWAAGKGREKLAVQWAPGSKGQFGNDAVQTRLTGLLAGRGDILERRGNPETAFEQSPHRIEATYNLPFWTHATMEPMSCAAHYHDGRCEVWAPVQSLSRATEWAAVAAGLPPAAVTVHLTYLGGGFGRRLYPDYVVQAVQLSRLLGKPVQVLWTREDDIRQGFCHPATKTRLQAGFDDTGIRCLIQRAACLSAHPEATQVGMTNSRYEIPAVSFETLREDENWGIRTGSYRSVGANHNAFTQECFLDEIAHAMNRDPYQLRRELLTGQPRMRQVLDQAVKRAAWAKPRPANVGLGLAIHTKTSSPDRNLKSHVACVARVRADNGRLEVERLTVVLDCGLAVNPKLVEAQVESAVAFSLTNYLKSRMSFEQGRVVQGNFDDYPVLRMHEMPELDIEIIRSSDMPGPIGELAGPAAGAAMCNAIFAAGGKRIRDFPLQTPG